MERISTDTVEHLTLIEKLNDHKETITVLRGTEKQGGHEFTFLGHHLLGFQTAVDIVKQHSDWVSVNEQKPQDHIAYLVLCDNGSVWVGHYNLPIKLNRWYLHGWSTHGGWHPFVITHFMLPPKPPSEVQDD